MASSLAAPINPILLPWARETIGYTVEAAARKFGIKPEKLTAIETGELAASFAMLKKASDVYKFPLAAFFLPTPPEREVVIHDFRLQAGVSQRPYAPRLNSEIIQARMRRDDALDLAREIELKISPFNHTATANEDPVIVAARVRKLLGITLEKQFAVRRKENALKLWKSAVEELGVLIFETSRISLGEMRGVSLPSDTLPIIIINGGDAHSGRIFTLLHEFTHLLLRQGGVCDFADGDVDTTDARIEEFCNAVAGNILVPTDALLSTTHQDGIHEWTMAKLDEISQLFSVSRYVILRRLLTLDIISRSYYRDTSAELDEEFRRRKERQRAESSGGPPPSVMVVRNLGQPFVKLVLDAYSQDRITLSTASDYLGVKIKHLKRIETLVYGHEAHV